MIHIKSPEEIKTMREGGRILAEILKKLSDAVRPGKTTQDLDKLARELVLFYKVKAAFLDYGGYPAALCASVNENVVHCAPSPGQLKEGDIISLDMGIIYNGFNLDAALTLPVLGRLSYREWSKQNPKHRELIEMTQEALNVGIKQAKAGNRVGKIGHAIQSIVEKHGFGVIRELVGHGVGRALHEEPQVPNFGSASEGVVLKEGMVIAIEPMVSLGGWQLVKGGDGFSYKTKDGSVSAHFEHTIAITKKGPLILTK